MKTLSVPTRGTAFLRNGYSYVHELMLMATDDYNVEVANAEYYNGERVWIEAVNSRGSVTNGHIIVTRETMLQMALKIINDPTFNPEQSVTFKNPTDNQRDLVLQDTGLWVEVDNIQIYIRRTNDGVSVELFGDTDEVSAVDEIASAYVTFAEAHGAYEEVNDDSLLD